MGRSDEGVWCVLLPAEPQLRSELALLHDRISETNDVDLVLDLSRVEILSSPSLGTLLGLHRLLLDKGRRLILCQLRLVTRGILRVAGLGSVFNLAETKTEALRALEQSF
jgi:anti-anti-sigma factor